MRVTPIRPYTIPDGDDFANGYSSLWVPARQVESDLQALEPRRNAAYDTPALILHKAGGGPITGSPAQQIFNFTTIFDNFGCFCNQGLDRFSPGTREWWEVGWFFGIRQTSGTPSGQRTIRLTVTTQRDPLDPESEQVFHRFKSERDANLTDGECLLVDTTIRLIGGGTVTLWVEHTIPAPANLEQVGDSLFWASMIRQEQI